MITAQASDPRGVAALVRRSGAGEVAQKLHQQVLRHVGRDGAAIDLSWICIAASPYMSLLVGLFLESSRQVPALTAERLIHRRSP